VRKSGNLISVRRRRELEHGGREERMNATKGAIMSLLTDA